MESLYDTPTISSATLNEEFIRIVAAADAEELDQMLQVFHSAIVCISQWCNTFAPAACLPGDILLLVFEHALPDRDTRMLRSLSQVCRWWRSIILHAPLLWRKALNLADRSVWFSEVLRRTCTVPLEVFFDVAEDYTSYVIPNLTAVMIDNLWRCASLHIEGYGDDIEEIVSSRTRIDRVPLLRRLLIRNISCSVPSTPDGEAGIPDSFLSVLAPQLTSLHLEGCTFNWDIVHTRLAPRSPLLSSLFIRSFHIQSAATVAQLLSVLALLPNLKDLSLPNSFVSGETDGNVPFRKVLLSQLTSLAFESSTVAGAIFLAAFELPSLAKLEAAIDVGQVSTNVHQFMEGVHLATCKMAHLPLLHICYGHRILIFQSSHYHHFPRLRVMFMNCHEGLQAQSQLLPSLEQVAMPSIPELEVLIDILAEARSRVGTPFAISAISQMHPRRTGPPIEVVHELMLDWLTNLVVDGIPGDSVWFVDDEITDSDDELDKLLDKVDSDSE
ncbi:hypothetical protein EV401DRAFT_1883330 [Pisolithus croceorrhizus]|nr:hypothetical protein EV401DRAFT_1883330 [Pisolithus croceorrhizus]